jgi:F-type H+-transporting ATPase subunit alpha
VPLNVIDQILIIYAGTRGHLDKIPANQVQAWEKQFLTFIHQQKQELWDELNTKKDLSDDLVQKVEAAIKQFQTQFAAGGAKNAAEKREPVAV